MAQAIYLQWQPFGPCCLLNASFTRRYSQGTGNMLANLHHLARMKNLSCLARYELRSSCPPDSSPQQAKTTFPYTDCFLHIAPTTGSSRNTYPTAMVFSRVIYVLWNSVVPMNAAAFLIFTLFYDEIHNYHAKHIRIAGILDNNKVSWIQKHFQGFRHTILIPHSHHQITLCPAWWVMPLLDHPL